jgi:methylphosphotriester-DNA--protein-cysteine methyltransferase
MNANEKLIMQLDNLFESYFLELRAMTDDEVLDGESPSAVKARAADMLKSAKAEAGRRRLATARAQMQKANIAVDDFAADVSIEQAKTYIAQVANDHRFTLAARKLGEMPDVEVMRLYQQIRRLESENLPGSDL